MSNRVLRILLLLMFAVLAGCASLPAPIERPISQARTDVAGTRLASVAAASMAEQDPHLSGLRLLPAGDQAFEARIALARAAEKSIDAQSGVRAVRGGIGESCCSSATVALDHESGRGNRAVICCHLPAG